MPDLKLSLATLIPKSQDLYTVDMHAFICLLYLFLIFLTRSPACVFNTDVTPHEHRIILLPSTDYITKGKFILKSIA